MRQYSGREVSSLRTKLSYAVCRSACAILRRCMALAFTSLTVAKDTLSRLRSAEEVMIGPSMMDDSARSSVSNGSDRQRTWDKYKGKLRLSSVSPLSNPASFSEVFGARMTGHHQSRQGNLRVNMQPQQPILICVETPPPSYAHNTTAHCSNSDATDPKSETHLEQNIWCCGKPILGDFLPILSHVSLVLQANSGLCRGNPMGRLDWRVF